MVRDFSSFFWVALSIKRLLFILPTILLIFPTESTPKIRSGYQLSAGVNTELPMPGAKSDSVQYWAGRSFVQDQTFLQEISCSLPFRTWKRDVIKSERTSLK